MNFDDDSFDANDDAEIGSDELLSDDSLRLPEGANILVRVHAVRAWLSRRREEAVAAVGDAALVLQETMQLVQGPESRLRRRERLAQQEQLDRIQQRLNETQARLHAYEEAQNLLEECIAHTSGERVLVEYYLQLEELVLHILQEDSKAPLEISDAAEGLNTAEARQTDARLQALADVQQRVERIGTPNEDEG